MKKQKDIPFHIHSITEQHRLLGLPKPQHPLVSVFRFENVTYTPELVNMPFTMDLYCVAIKKNFTGKMKYGQQYYDFDEGMISFISPRQILSVTDDDNNPTEGYNLVFHPDFIAGYPLAAAIKNYGFFSYSLHEALYLSDKEEAMVDTIMRNIEQEYNSPIDHFSQDVMISHIELLLNYSNRFYNRQFITRKPGNHEILTRLEQLLADYFAGKAVQEQGLPTVQYVARQMNISPNYLSDALRTLTGQSTQQHIHHKIIETAKEMLSTTALSVSEVAYRLGFEYPQSFNKLFKSKTQLSPLEYRQSFQ